MGWIIFIFNDFSWYILNWIRMRPMLRHFGSYWSLVSQFSADPALPEAVSAVPSPAEVLEHSLHRAREPCFRWAGRSRGHATKSDLLERTVAVPGSPLPHCPLGPFSLLVKLIEIQILPINVSRKAECRTTALIFFSGKKQELQSICLA